MLIFSSFVLKIINIKYHLQIIFKLFSVSVTSRKYDINIYISRYYITFYHKNSKKNMTF